MRLDKYLADMGAGTRSELKKAVRAGRVTVNGERAKDPAAQVAPQDEVCLDGKRIAFFAFAAAAILATVLLRAHWSLIPLLVFAFYILENIAAACFKR